MSAILELNYELFLHDLPYDAALNTNWPHQKEGKKKGAQSMFVVAYSGNADALAFYGSKGALASMP